MIFGWSFAGGRLSLGNAVIEQLSLEMWERNWALAPFREAGSGAEGWTKPLEPWDESSHVPNPQPLEEAARGFVL